MSIFDDIAKKVFGSSDTNSSPSSKKPETVNSQSDEDKKLAGWVRSKVEELRGQANRISQEGIWMTNVSYLLGYTNVYYDASLRQFKSSDGGTRNLRRNRCQTNLILPAVQNRLARLLKSPPKYDVRPNSMDSEDKEGSKLGLEVIGMLWDKQRVNEKRITLGMWIQQCGHAYGKVSWDEEAGELLPDLNSSLSEEPIEDDELGEQKFQGYEGDIVFEVCSPFEIFPDPLAKTFEDISFLIQAKVRPLDYFRTRFSDTGGDLVESEGAWLLSTQFEMRINTLNTVQPANSGVAEQMKNAAIELSYYEKRSKKYPKGRHIITSNGVLLKNDELPVGEIPFAKFDDVVIGGKYNSESLITHARPIQDQFNRSMQKRADWINKLLAGKYIAARGSGLIQEAINDQSGEVIEYDPVPGANEPHAIEPPVMPPYIFQETQYLEKKLFDTFGLSEVSRGQLPSASIPAVGMQLLLEQDETRIGIETEQHEHSWARIGSLFLKYVSTFYVMDRKLKTKNKAGEFDIRHFNGEMLKQNYDVTVIRGSTVPNSKILKRQELLNIFNMGLLGNPQDPSVREKVLGFLEYGEVGEVWRDFELDMNQIKKSIKQIENEQIPIVAKMDNHALHLSEKNAYRKSDRYEVLSDISKKILEQDMQRHLDVMSYLANPGLAQPPDNGPHPKLVLAHMHNQARALGIDHLLQGPQNNNIPPGAPVPPSAGPLPGGIPAPINAPRPPMPPRPMGKPQGRR